MRLKYPLLFTTLLFCANSYAIEIFGMNLGFGYDSYEECVFDKVKQCGAKDYGCKKAGEGLCNKECPFKDPYFYNVPILIDRSSNSNTIVNNSGWPDLYNLLTVRQLVPKNCDVDVEKIFFRVGCDNPPPTREADIRISCSYKKSFWEFSDSSVLNGEQCVKIWGQGPRTRGERACE